MLVLISRDVHSTAVQGHGIDLTSDRPVFSTGNVVTLAGVIVFLAFLTSWAFKIPMRLRKWRSRSRRAALRPLTLPGVAELRRNSAKSQVRISKPIKSRSLDSCGAKGSSLTPVEIEAGSIDTHTWKTEPDIRWSRESDGAGLLPYPRTAYVSPAKKRTLGSPVRLFRNKDGRPFFASKLPGKASADTTIKETGQGRPFFFYEPLTIQPYEKLKTLPFVPSD
ncbi:hypothetical protein FRB90_010927 [Tulasnella sp. 427]|nr:hypothetical protein FRB90_010927 [Tulasnella sp. 427]